MPYSIENFFLNPLDLNHILFSPLLCIPENILPYSFTHCKWDSKGIPA